MKLYDFDGMFDEKLSEYIAKNPDKYTESEWEDVIPKMYRKFGDTFIKSVGDTPKGFYKKLSDEQLVTALTTHLKKQVPVSEFLYSELEKRDVFGLLAPLLDGSDSEKECAVNLIGSDERVLEKYLEMLVSDNTDGELKGKLADLLKEKADLVADKAVNYYGQGVEKEYMLEIMSRSVIRSDKIFDILIKEFRGNIDNLPVCAGYLATYGDERALPYLLDKIDEEGISFIEYKELLMAIESLGGTYDKQRDFSSDPYYGLIKSHELSAADIFENLKDK